MGKGELRESLLKNNIFIDETYDLYIGIKQSISILKKKDIFILNDFEGVFGLEDIFTDIEYILCPIYPNVKWEKNMLF